MYNYHKKMNLVGILLLTESLCVFFTSFRTKIFYYVKMRCLEGVNIHKFYFCFRVYFVFLLYLIFKSSDFEIPDSVSSLPSGIVRQRRGTVALDVLDNKNHLNVEDDSL